MLQQILSQIISCLVEVLVISVEHMVHDFPNHIMSRFLMDRTPGYSNWAERSRQQAEALFEVLAHECDQTHALNKAAAVAL